MKCREENDNRYEHDEGSQHDSTMPIHLRTLAIRISAIVTVRGPIKQPQCADERRRDLTEKIMI